MTRRKVRLVFEHDVDVVGDAKLSDIVAAARPMLFPALVPPNTCIVAKGWRIVGSEELRPDEQAA